MAELGETSDRKAILTLRRQVRFQDGRPYDARRRPAALEARFGWPRKFGRLRLLDATADQFESRWLGDIVMLEASE